MEINQDVEFNKTEEHESSSSLLHIDDVIEYLIKNDGVYFKNQQRDENDLTNEEKANIAREVFQKSKASFLVRFGKFLKHDHLMFFNQYTEGNPDSGEVKILLSNLTRFHSKTDHLLLETKNRRYEAMKRLIEENSYFTETEMMKRNPLLYQQLVGQYLTADEKRERDRNGDNNTLVKILLEGIERDEADDKLKLQQEEEDNAMEEDDSDESSADEAVPVVSRAYTKPSTSRWGEFTDLQEDAIRKNAIVNTRQVFVTAEERQLLKQEFISLMYQSFLDGKDDFDYATIDNNDQYDNIDILALDEEDKYFDSEEPEDLRMEESGRYAESSEDELDIYMNALNQHPAVFKLSKDLEKL